MSKPRVVYWNNMPSPYAVKRFNAVVERGNIDLEVWFDRERASDRSWTVDCSEWQFRARYLNECSLLGHKLRLPLAELQETRPDLLVSDYHRANYALGSVAARVWAARVAYRALPNYDAWSERTWWREGSKHFLFRAIDGAKVPGADGGRLSQRYGLPAVRAHQVMQSIDIDHFKRARLVDGRSRWRLRQQLGLEGCVFLYVGRLWSGKGLDYLFEAYRAVAAKCPNVSLLLVGDGVDEEYYRTAVSPDERIRFAGFVKRQDLPTYYALADVFVFPTLGDPHGLVVEEAMAAGLPVICSDAAGDIRERVPDGKAGHVVAAADAKVLAGRMHTLAAAPTIRKAMAAETLKLVAHRVHAQYAEDFEAFVAQTLSLPPRKTLASFVAGVAGRYVLPLLVRDAVAANVLEPQSKDEAATDKTLLKTDEGNG